MHPGIRGQDPKRGSQRSEGDHEGSQVVHSWTNAVPAEQHDPQETGLEEEGAHDLVGHERPDDIAGDLRKAAEVGAELIGQDDPEHDPQAEAEGEDARPEGKKLAV